MASLLESISLSQHINDAILNQLGNEGKVLEISIHYEKGAWDKIDWTYLELNGVSAEQLAQIYVDTLEWVDKTINDLGIGDKK